MRMNPVTQAELMRTHEAELRRRFDATDHRFQVPASTSPLARRVALAVISLTPILVAIATVAPRLRG